MRLSRLGTDSSLPPDYQGFRAASELGRSILAAGQVSRAVAGPPPIGVVRRPFKEPPLTAESGGATRAALLAMRAHRGTGSSNPLPSSGESVANLLPLLGATRTTRLRRVAGSSRVAWHERLPLF